MLSAMKAKVLVLLPLPTKLADGLRLEGVSLEKRLAPKIGSSAPNLPVDRFWLSVRIGLGYPLNTKVTISKLLVLVEMSIEEVECVIT